MQILINVPDNQHKHTHGQIARTPGKNNIISVIQDAILAKMVFAKQNGKYDNLKQNTIFPQPRF